MNKYTRAREGSCSVIIYVRIDKYVPPHRYEIYTAQATARRTIRRTPGVVIY